MNSRTGPSSAAQGHVSTCRACACAWCAWCAQVVASTAGAAISSTPRRARALLRNHEPSCYSVSAVACAAAIRPPPPASARLPFCCVRRQWVWPWVSAPLFPKGIGCALFRCPLESPAPSDGAAPPPTICASLARCFSFRTSYDCEDEARDAIRMRRDSYEGHEQGHSHSCRRFELAEPRRAEAARA